MWEAKQPQSHRQQIDQQMDEAQKHIYNYRSPRESIDSDSSARVDLKKSEGAEHNNRKLSGWKVFSGRR